MYDGIPQRMMDSLERYLEHGVEPGGFLRAVLENDLVGAFGRADAENMRAMKAWASYIYNEVPSGSWGSPEIVKAWLDKFTE